MEECRAHGSIPSPAKENKGKQPSQTELSDEKTQLNNLIVSASQYQF